MRTIAHATWKDWAHVGWSYRVRNRHNGQPSAYSDKDGFMWFDSYKHPVERPCDAIQFHGGPRDGEISRKNPTEGQLRYIRKAVEMGKENT